MTSTYIATLSTKYHLPQYYHLTLSQKELDNFISTWKHLAWRLAMQSKYDALIKNQTWTLVLKPPNTNIIDCKWIFWLKLKLDGP